MMRSRSTANAVRVGDGSSPVSRFPSELFVAYGASVVPSSSSERSRMRSDATLRSRESFALRSTLVAMPRMLAVLLPRSRDRRLRRREARDRHPIRRRRHVGETGVVAERDRRWVAAVLAADPDLETRARPAPALDRDPHHGAEAVAVEHLERVRRDDLLLAVCGEEALLRVAPRDPQERLREVVRAEGEELGFRRDLVGDEARARDLDHRPELVGHLLAALLEDG